MLRFDLAAYPDPAPPRLRATRAVPRAAHPLASSGPKARQAFMKAQLRRVLERPGCSRDAYEIASMSLL